MTMEPAHFLINASKLDPQRDRIKDSSHCALWKKQSSHHLHGQYSPPKPLWDPAGQRIPITLLTTKLISMMEYWTQEYKAANLVLLCKHATSEPQCHPVPRLPFYWEEKTWKVLQTIKLPSIWFLKVAFLPANTQGSSSTAHSWEASSAYLDSKRLFCCIVLWASLPVTNPFCECTHEYLPSVRPCVECGGCETMMRCLGNLLAFNKVC